MPVETKQAKQERLARARARVEKTIAEFPASLESAFQAHRDFGPSYGYRDPQDWWETEVEWHPELFKGDDAIQQPAFVTDYVAPQPAEQTPDEQRARDFLGAYTGSFEFLVDMRRKAQAGATFSPKQLAAVLRCADRDSAPADPRLEEARAYLNELNLAGRLNDFTDSLYRQLESKGSLSPKQIDALLRGKERDAAPQAQAAPVTEGMYRKADGTIYKVQRAVHGSGNLYAKRLLPPDEFGGTAHFEYEAGAIRKLTADEKMTLEQAREFGALYGTCCVCGRTLTDETSIAQGIGPVCAGREENWA